MGSVEQTTPEEMRALMETNYMGVFHGCQAALSQMRKQGSGHVINVSSMAARFPLPLHAGYTATKWAVSGLTEALAIEMSGSGIEVSLVMPGLTETDFSSAAINKIPDVPGRSFGGVATAREVAEEIVRCVKRPRAVVEMAPLPRVVLAIYSLIPSVWRALGSRICAHSDGREGDSRGVADE